MTEYGEKLVHAGARKIMEALTLKGDVSASERALVRVLYGAFLDGLENEPLPESLRDEVLDEIVADNIVCRVDSCHGLTIQTYLSRHLLLKLVRTLRTEIEAPDQAREGPR